MRYRLRFHKRLRNGKLGKTKVSIEIETELSNQEVKRNKDRILEAAFYMKREEEEDFSQWELTNIHRLES